MLRGNRSHVGWLEKKHIRSSIDLLPLQLPARAAQYSHIEPSRWLWKIKPVWENSHSKYLPDRSAAQGPVTAGSARRRWNALTGSICVAALAQGS